MGNTGKAQTSKSWSLLFHFQPHSKLGPISLRCSWGCAKHPIHIYNLGTNTCTMGRSPSCVSVGRAKYKNESQ